MREQRGKEIIRTLPIPRPFDLEQFRVRLARQRGRKLRFVPTPGRQPPGRQPPGRQSAGRQSAGRQSAGRQSAGRELAGLWIATATEDHIFYPGDAPPLGQLYVIAREIGHMVLAHEGAPAATSEMARLLLPALDPALVVATLGKARYPAADEQEAEAFAALLLDHMEVVAPAQYGAGAATSLRDG